MSPARNSNKIPITLITGYLGAGKTTLLRQIITSAKGRKIGILMNEFGDIGIDGKLVRGKDVNLVELAGGCICCSLSGEFEAALAELLGKYSLDWIVIETTGVAEPSALTSDVIENIPGVRLDAIITIVDADALVRFPNLGHTGREQIEMADLLLINKIDLVSQGSRLELSDALRAINPKVAMVECVQCKVDISILFGPNTAGKRKHHKNHSPDFEYFDFIIDDSKTKLDFDKLQIFVNTLPEFIYRSKGFVKTDKGDFLMNYVAGRSSFEKFRCKKTELVFLGKNIMQFSQILLKKLEEMKI